MFKPLLFTVGLLAVASACTDPAANPDAAAAADESHDEVAVPDETVFRETVVDVGPDGERRVSERTITAGEERAQNLARERAPAGGTASAVGRDGACGDSSFWLYDRPDWTGNLLCLSGEGTARLAGYRRLTFCSGSNCAVVNWFINEGSMWAGSSGGTIWSDSQPEPMGKGVDGRNATGWQFKRFQKFELTKAVEFVRLGT